MKRYWCLDSELCFYHVIIKVPDNTYGNGAYAFDVFHKGDIVPERFLKFI